MLIRLTRSNHSAQLILLILLAILFWSRNFFAHTPIEIIEPQTFLYRTLFGWTQHHLVLAKILAFVCVFLQAFWLNEVVRTHSLSKNPIFVALIYIVLMSAQNTWQTMQPFLITNFFIIGGFSYLFKLYDRKEPYEFVFNASALFALATLFSASLLLFATVVFGVLLSFLIHKWREWLITVLGFAFPFLIVFLVASLTDNLDLFSDFLIPIMDFGSLENIGKASWPIQIFRLVAVVIALPGMIFMRIHAKDNEISQRKKIAALTLGVFWIIITTLATFYTPVNLAGLFVFFAFFIAEWFYRIERQLPAEMIFGIFLVAAIGATYI